MYPAHIYTYKYKYHMNVYSQVPRGEVAAEAVATLNSVCVIICVCTYMCTRYI